MRQKDVFIARADGTEARNLSANPGDDFDVSWSPDGSLLAFTSNRAGGSRVYVYDFDGTRLWSVSDQSNEGHAVFSPDGRSIAFESTREGDLAVYVRPALGGTARRVTPRGRQFSIAAWRGESEPPYIDRLRIIGTSAIANGDSARLDLFALTHDGRAVRPPNVRWVFLDRDVVRPSRDTADTASLSADVVARGIGDARVVAEIPGWRADTVVIAATSTQAVQITDLFDRATFDSRWRPLGRPAPFTGQAPGSTTPAAFPNGDVEWDSGLLLRQTLELRPGLRARLRIYAPFVGRPTQATLFVGFVAAGASASIDSTAPQFAPLVSTTWEGASGNFVYAVGRQTQSEAATSFNGANNHEIEIRVDDTRSVVFSIDGRVRWTSSLNFVGDMRGTPVRLWIGGRATGSSVAVAEFSLDQPGRSR
jgi:dipeptidyl aminopeptidase/acylaminoacyl peptidase